jgi:protein-disulfide isomerase
MAQTRRERLRVERAAKAKRVRRARIAGFGALVIAVVVVAALVVVLVQNNLATGQLTPPNATSDRSGISPYPGAVKAGAPVVDFFFDYQCPGCASVETYYGDTLAAAAQAGQINLRYRPLTFLDENLANDSSERAARAAACADVVGSYASYHQTIFANQPSKEGTGYTDDQLRVTFASTAGITGDALTRFQQCYDRKQTADFVAEAYSKNLPASTPRMTVNGNSFELGAAASGLIAAINAAA